MKRTNLPPKAIRCPRCHEKKKRNQAYCADCLSLQECRPNMFEWAGYRPCKLCVERGKTNAQAMFWSQHVKKVRHCDDCRKELDHLEDSLGGYGHRYDVLEKQTDGSFYACRVKLQQKVGGKMTAPLRRAIYANQHAKAIVGIEVKHLSPEEIAARYTPAYVDQLFAQAKKNAKGLYCILGEVKQL